MNRRRFLSLGLLPLAFLIMACARQEPTEPTATTSAASTSLDPATVIAPPNIVTPSATVSLPTPPPPLSSSDVAALLSGPTPTAVPLPTESSEVVVVTTRAVERESSSEGAPSGINVFAVPANEEQVSASEHFTLYAEEGAWVPPEEIGPIAEEILEYVSRRLGAVYDKSMSEPIDVLFRVPPDVACPPRGMAVSDPPKELQETPIIHVFAGDETSHDQILGVLAHEVAHVLHARTLEQGLSQDRALNEGFAHWLSADYVYAWYGTSSYDALVRGYVDADNYVPLQQYGLYLIYPGSTVDDGNCLQRRDQLYSEWASFISFLIESYGIESFLELMNSPTRERSAEKVILYPPDYQGVYGLTLNQLEVVWLRHLLGE